MRSRLKRAFAWALPLIALLALANMLWEQDVHAWRYAGECLDCHAKQDDAPPKSGWTIPPPDSHDARFRRYTHGKAEGFSFARCAACHRSAECRDCHAMAPESHTRDFMQPQGLGMERHIMLGRVRPATCLGCHESFQRDCALCHTPAELAPWEDQVRKTAAGWGMRP